MKRFHKLFLRLCVAIVIGVTGWLVSNVRIVYECSAEFTYDKRARLVQGKDAIEWARRLAVDSTKSYLRALSSEETVKYVVKRIEAGFGAGACSSERVERILASIKAEVDCRPTADFAVPCRLTVADRDNALLQEILQFCVSAIEEKVAYDNDTLVAKAGYNEFQEKAKLERRIAGLARKRDDGGLVSEELSLTHRHLSEVNARIDQLRNKIFETGCPCVRDVAVSTTKWRLTWAKARNSALFEATFTVTVLKGKDKTPFCSTCSLLAKKFGTDALARQVIDRQRRAGCRIDDSEEELVASSVRLDVVSTEQGAVLSFVSRAGCAGLAEDIARAYLAELDKVVSKEYSDMVEKGVSQLAEKCKSLEMELTKITDLLAQGGTVEAEARRRLEERRDAVKKSLELEKERIDDMKREYLGQYSILVVVKPILVCKVKKQSEPM